MAINYQELTTSDIRMWNMDDALKFLSYLHRDNQGLVFTSHVTTTVLVPTGDYSGFIVNDRKVISTRSAASKIVDAIARDYRGRDARETREFYRSVTGRMNGRPNTVDRIESAACNAVEDFLYRVFG